MRGEQIAFHALGDERQRTPPFFAGGDSLALRGEPLADPIRQLRALDRIDLQRDARVGQSREPRRLLRGRVEPRQRDHGEHVVIDGSSERFQRVRAFLAGLARRNTQLDQLTVAEQRHRLARAQQRTPVEPALDREHRAVGEAGRARRGANPVARFLREQVLVAVHDVQSGESLGEMRFERVKSQLHGYRSARLNRYGTLNKANGIRRSQRRRR